MSAKKGNAYWKARRRHGPAPKFKPRELWKSCLQYFQWSAENPLYKSELFRSIDGPELVAVPKLRALTIAGLCAFLGISYPTWASYRSRVEYQQVVERVEAMIRVQKIEGTAAGLFSPAIIIRELALADKKDVREKGQIFVIRSDSG